MPENDYGDIIKDTLALIDTTPDNDEMGVPTAWFALDNRRITTADLKSVAASLTRLLKAAKAVYRIAERRTVEFDELKAAIEEAENYYA
jgi:hypothetical protein